MVEIAIAIALLAVVEIARLVVDVLFGTAIKQELSDIAGALDVYHVQMNRHINPRPATEVHLEELEIPAAQPVTMPNDVLDYIEAESEQWAQVDRRNRAWELYGQSHDWQKVLQDLGRDDGEVAENPQL